MILLLAEMDAIPIWTAGGVITILTLLGTAIKWLLGWFRDVSANQQAHEKILADKWAERGEQSLKQIALVSSQFDSTARELYKLQQDGSVRMVGALLEIQEKMLQTILALKEQSAKVESSIGELRRELQSNSNEVKQIIGFLPESKVERVRKMSPIRQQ